MSTAVMLIVTACWACSLGAVTGEEVQSRIARDLDAGRPIVVHVTVSLCDNANQGIVPVPQRLGNGQDPQSNLYWGALYGVRSYFVQRAGWKRVPADEPAEARILERVVMFSRVERGDKTVPVYVVADAWDGAAISSAVGAFLSMCAGGSTCTVSVRHEGVAVHLEAGGFAHVVAYVGHNGLMDFSPPENVESLSGTRPKSAMVLACASRQYFLEILRSTASHPLLLTTGLMAPEAYSLDAAVREWIGGGSVADVGDAAVQAYCVYQGCNPHAARSLFWGSAP